MKKLDDQIAMIERQISDLQIKRQGLVEFRASLNGEAEAPVVKKRATNVKPLVLDLMKSAGPTGATSSEVYEQARERNPAVGRDTISSVLSRLKGDGALKHDGERYFVVGVQRTGWPSQSVN